MESSYSSPDHTKASSSSDAKKENSPGGSECDENLSLSSSACGSEANEVSSSYRDSGIKNRTNNKTTLKNFRNVKSFRRRARSRTANRTSVQSPTEILEASPHYMKATSCSKGKNALVQGSHQHSEFCIDNSDHGSLHSSQSNLSSPGFESLQTPASSIGKVKILFKKTSFKPKRSSLKYCQVSKDVHVDRATCSSTLKDSKFAKHVDLLPGETESEKVSSMKVCQYHHCSLHGHCDKNHDPVPQTKRLYRRRWSLKKQKSIKPRSESRPVPKSFSDKKKRLLKSQMIPNVHPSVHNAVSDNSAFSYVSNENVMESGVEIATKPATRLFGEGYGGIRKSVLVEIAYGETSYPEENYEESLNRITNYLTRDQGMAGAASNQKEICLKCSCIKTEPNESKTTADVELPCNQVSDTKIRNEYIRQTSQHGAADFSATRSSAFSMKQDKHVDSDNKAAATSSGGEIDFKSSTRTSALNPDKFDDVAESNSVVSSDLDGQIPKYGNPGSEREFTTEFTSVGDSESSEVQDKNTEVNTPSHEAHKPRFSEVRHISMWHLIHQHMAAGMAAESENNSLQDAGCSNTLPAKASSAPCQGFSASDSGTQNNESETQDIEVRKLLAVKLVREAIEKILLPEVQDPSSDDQSFTSYVKESNRESEADKEEGSAPSDMNEVSLSTNDIPGPETMQTDKMVESKSEKKAPKHWSNLKKWILLQRFIKELEKVRKLNQRSPRHLPLKPDPESEKVNLRPQTTDERKNAEEWMLDYALRQAVNQLAPTQKRKVALLVKAFETVVQPQDDNTPKFASITPKFKSVSKENVTDKEFGIMSFPGKQLEGDGKAPVASDDINSSLASSNLDGNGMAQATEGTIPLAAHCDALEIEKTARDGVDGEAMLELREPQDDTRSDSNESEINNGTPNIQLDRQNYMKMWHLIYQHVVSGIAAKVGSQLLDGTDDDEEEDCNESPKRNNGDNFHALRKSDDDSDKENHVSSHLRSVFTKNDALKLVQEAVDEILIPEIQDDPSDTQSVASGFCPDQEISERNSISVGEQSMLNSARKLEPLKSKNWSKLKKLILLKRSMRALEKARKVNPQPHRKLSVMTDPEQEKTDLRHQMMDERKKAEQWMLDYAVQHIVTRLTPSRKRRVSMLVEAFEAVVPLPEISMQ